jgi:hypothetical protein
MPEIPGDRMDGQTEDFLGLEDLDEEKRTFQAGHRGTLIFGAKPDNTDNPNLEQGKRVNFRVVNDDDGGGILELTFPDSEDVDEKGKPPGVSIKFSDCGEILNPALRFFLDIKDDKEQPKDLVRFILIPKGGGSIVDRFRLDPVGDSTVSIASEYDLFDSLSLPDSTEVQKPKTPLEILKQVSHRDYRLEDHRKFRLQGIKSPIQSSNELLVTNDSCTLKVYVNRLDMHDTRFNNPYKVSVICIDADGDVTHGSFFALDFDAQGKLYLGAASLLGEPNTSYGYFKDPDWHKSLVKLENPEGVDSVWGNVDKRIPTDIKSSFWMRGLQVYPAEPIVPEDGLLTGIMDLLEECLDS